MSQLNLPPRLRAAAQVFTPPSLSASTVQPPRLRPTAKAFEPAMNLSTSRPPSAAPDVEPKHPRYELYIDIARFCCQSIDLDPEDLKDGEDFEAFLARCNRHIEFYPTQQALREHIKTEPLMESISRLQDFHPNLDEGIRLLAGWESNGSADSVGSLTAVSHITMLGRKTTQRFPGSVLISPSRALCGRANALTAYVNYELSRNTLNPGATFEPSERYHGPPSQEWQFFLVAVAHAADAARQKIISPIVLIIGYAFRDIANRLGCNLQNGDFLTPLLRALRRHESTFPQEAQKHIPPKLLEVVDGQTGEQLRRWVIDISQHFKDRPDPYWDGKAPLIPLPYTSWNGILND